MQSFYCSTFQERKSHCFGHSEPVSPEHHTTSLREQHFTGMNSGLEQGSPSTVMHQEAFFFPILEGKWASTNSDEARSCCLSRKQHGRQDVWCLEGSRSHCFMHKPLPNNHSSWTCCTPFKTLPPAVGGKQVRGF